MNTSRFSFRFRCFRAALAVVIFLLWAGEDLFSRGFEGGGRMGGGERTGEERTEFPRSDKDEFRGDYSNGNINRDDSVDITGKDGKSVDVNVTRDDGTANVNVSGPDGKSASASVEKEGDGFSKVQVQGPDGRTYDATYHSEVVGPDGFRTGYVWRDGTYERVNIAPLVPYVAPFGTFAGWTIVTQPAFVEYPVYATYPVETAAQVQLTSLGFYEGPIDGLLSSVVAAIEACQQANNLEVTGQLTPSFLEVIDIEVSE